MNTRQIAVSINAYVIAHSNLDLKRNYLGISKIGNCPRQAAHEFIHGILPSEEAYRMSFAGYEQERAILSMLQQIGIAYPAQREIIAPFDPRLRGHIDGETSDGFLCEVKSTSVLKYKNLQKSEHVPFRHFVQVQLYMRYAGYERALMVYRCRETYETMLFDLAYNPVKAEQFEQKAKYILHCIDTAKIPDCECGHCQT